MKTKIFTVFIFALVVGFGIGKINFQNSEASVMPAGEYQSVAISSAQASNAIPFTVATTSSALGSIIISSSTPLGIIGVYDGVSSTTAPSSATTSGRLIGKIRPGTAEQTLTYDANIINGLILDIPATFLGNLTVTYRGY